jgi:hypothetical protein
MPRIATGLILLLGSRKVVEELAREPGGVVVERGAGGNAALFSGLPTYPGTSLRFRRSGMGPVAQPVFKTGEVV